MEMDNDRLTKQAFLWDKNCRQPNWSSVIFFSFIRYWEHNSFHLSIHVNIETERTSLHNAYIQEWSDEKAMHLN